MGRFAAAIARWEHLTARVGVDHVQVAVRAVSFAVVVGRARGPDVLDPEDGDVVVEPGSEVSSWPPLHRP